MLSNPDGERDAREFEEHPNRGPRCQVTGNAPDPTTCECEVCWRESNMPPANCGQADLF